MAQKRTTRMAILEATISCIERYGLEHLTIRRIAVEAGSNIASINYYFRSKDHLVADAFSMTIKHMLQDVFAALEQSNQDFEKVLTEVLFYLLDGGLRYPGMTRAHLQRALSDSGRTTISGQAMARVFGGLLDRATSAYPSKSKRVLQLRLSQVLSGVMFTLLKPDFFDLGKGQRLTNSRQAKALAASYTAIFIAAL